MQSRACMTMVIGDNSAETTTSAVAPSSSPRQDQSRRRCVTHTATNPNAFGISKMTSVAINIQKDRSASTTGHCGNST